MTVAAIAAVIDLVTEPIIISVSARYRRRLAQIAHAEPALIDDLAVLDDGDCRSWHACLRQHGGDVCLELSLPLRGERQRRNSCQVGLRCRVFAGGWRGILGGCQRPNHQHEQQDHAGDQARHGAGSFCTDARAP